MSRKAAVQAAYEYIGTHASLYDGMMTDTSALGRIALRFLWRFSRKEYEEYTSQMFAGLPPAFAGSLLEVPVGTGVLSMPAYEKLPSADITCLDYSDKMLDVARALASKRRLSHIHFQQGDVGTLSFADEAFDIVLTINGLHAFPQKDAALDEMYRVLKRGGTFCGCCYVCGERTVTDTFVRTFCTWSGYFTPPYDTAEELRARLAARYDSVEIHTVGAFAEFICKKK